MYIIISDTNIKDMLNLFAASGGGGPMLVPPVAQGGTGGRPVGDTGTSRGQQSSAGATTLWPLAPAQSNQAPGQQSQATPPLAASPAPAHNQSMIISPISTFTISSIQNQQFIIHPFC